MQEPQSEDFHGLDARQSRVTVLHAGDVGAIALQSGMLSVRWDWSLCSTRNTLVR